MKVADKVYTPDGQAVVLEIDGTDVKVARIKANGEKTEVYYDASVLHKVPTKDDLETQASLTFRRAHPDFNPCAANVKLMTEYVRSHSTAWTADSLEAAFTALKSKLAPMPAVQPAPAIAAPPVAAVPVPASASAPAFTLTKRQVAAASKDQLKEWMADKPAGAVAALESLGIRTKLPARWRQ